MYFAFLCSCSFAIQTHCLLNKRLGNNNLLCFLIEHVITVQPLLMATSLQSPFFPPDGQKNSYIDSCLKPNGHLFTIATFFCPQGGRCREVQLYITTWLVKHPLKYGATCHGWIFCFLFHVTRSSTRFSITCSRFSILDSCRNGESSWA